MKLILNNDEQVEVDTSFIMNNQYKTIDGRHIRDVEVKKIIDDIRLTDFYCCKIKQGTYEEVKEAIKEGRNKINNCNDCFWFHTLTRIPEECEKKEIRDGNKRIITTKTTYELSCAYNGYENKKCCHDINEEPKLFREVNECFFCEYPEGIPDQKIIKQFLIDNAEKYNIVTRWETSELSIDIYLQCSKRFGSYTFEIYNNNPMFELSNARHSFKFNIDAKNKKFIIYDGIGYKVTNILTTSEYDWENNKCNDVPIKNWDKFAKWIFQIIDDFNNQ